MKIQRIALTTDFTTCAREAYGPTADLATRFGARIELVHWMDHPFPYMPFGLEQRWVREHREAARARLEAEAQDPLFKDVSVGPHLMDGYGSQGLERFLNDTHVDLVAQASHGYTGLKRVVRGSFTERLLRRAATPVLTFKADEGTPFAGTFLPTKILFPHDFSACSAHAAEAVRFFAKAYGARVVVLNAWQHLPTYYDFHGLAGDVMSTQLATLYQEMPARLGQDLTEFAARELAGIGHETRVMLGDPAELIVAQATSWGADLICMATHGGTGFQHLMFGSVAERVARTAPCPTLTVRPRDEALRAP